MTFKHEHVCEHEPLSENSNMFDAAAERTASPAALLRVGAQPRDVLTMSSVAVVVLESPMNV